MPGSSSRWESIASGFYCHAHSRVPHYRTAVEQGLIQGMNVDHFSYGEAVLNTDEFTAEQLISLRDKMMEELNAGA